MFEADERKLYLEWEVKEKMKGERENGKGGWNEKEGRRKKEGRKKKEGGRRKKETIKRTERKKNAIQEGACTTCIQNRPQST